MSGALTTALVGALLAWAPLAYAVQGVRAGRRGGLHDRVAVVQGLVGALVAVVLARALVPWESVPPVLWALLVAATALGAATSVLAWRSLPAVAGRHRPRRLVGAGAGVVVGLALLAIMLLG